MATEFLLGVIPHRLNWLYTNVNVSAHLLFSWFKWLSVKRSIKRDLLMIDESFQTFAASSFCHFWCCRSVFVPSWTNETSHVFLKRWRRGRVKRKRRRMEWWSQREEELDGAAVFVCSTLAQSDDFSIVCVKAAARMTAASRCSNISHDARTHAQCSAN